MLQPIQHSTVRAAETSTDTKTPLEVAPSHDVLPTPSLGVQLGDDAIATIAMMMAESFRGDRKTASHMRRLEEATIRAETRARVEAMRDKANHIRAEGVWEGVSTLAGGLLTAGGAGIALGTDSDAWTRLGSGAGDGTQGAGKLLGSGHRAAQTEADAVASEHELRADIAKRSAEECDQEVDEAHRMLSKIAEFLRSVRDSSNAAMQAATRRA